MGGLPHIPDGGSPRWSPPSSPARRGGGNQPRTSPGSKYLEEFRSFPSLHGTLPILRKKNGKLFTLPCTGAHCPLPCPGESASRRPLSALQPPGRPGAQYFEFFFQLFRLFSLPHTGAHCPLPCPGESASRRTLSALQPPGRPGAQYFATFSNFSDFFHFHTQGPTVPCPARGRAPPGGHSRHCSPRDALEPTAQYFATFPNFSDFFHFHTQGPTVPCPPC